jgi:hypothetical protein
MLEEKYKDLKEKFSFDESAKLFKISIYEYEILFKMISDHVLK